MAGLWRITSENNKKVNEGQVTSTDWTRSIILAAEAITLLNLI